MKLKFFKLSIGYFILSENKVKYKKDMGAEYKKVFAFKHNKEKLYGKPK